MGERQLDKLEVVGSIPTSPTISVAGKHPSPEKITVWGASHNRLQFSFSCTLWSELGDRSVPAHALVDVLRLAGVGDVA